MKLLSLGILVLALSGAANAAICDLNFNGCKTGAASIVSNGKALTNCLWLKDVRGTMNALVSTRTCSPAPKACEVKTSGCKAGAAWIQYDGKALTPCEWMEDFLRSYRTAYHAGICDSSYTACEYKPSSGCKTGAGQIFIGDQQITACEWLKDAGRIMNSLREVHACL